MARIVVLDAGPTGIASNDPALRSAVRCHAWLAALDAAGAEVLVPAIADYEVRRELIRAGATAGVARLDAFRARATFLPLSDAAFRLAAEFWAIVRNLGRPTAHPHALDGDAILAAQAALCGAPGDNVIIATTNVCDLARFPGIDARPWDRIAP
jgi:predicted nucleic acid-binding protein